MTPIANQKSRIRIVSAPAAGLVEVAAAFVLVAAGLDDHRGGVGRVHLAQGFELPGLDGAQAREQLALGLGVVLVGNLLQLVAHLEFEQLLLNHRLVVQLLIGELLNLPHDELEAVDRREQDVVYQEHKGYADSSPPLRRPARSDTTRARAAMSCRLRSCPAVSLAMASPVLSTITAMSLRVRSASF